MSTLVIRGTPSEYALVIRGTPSEYAVPELFLQHGPLLLPAAQASEALMIGEHLPVQPSERSSESHQSGVIRRNQVSSSVMKHLIFSDPHAMDVRPGWRGEVGGGGRTQEERWR